MRKIFVIYTLGRGLILWVYKELKKTITQLIGSQSINGLVKEIVIFLKEVQIVKQQKILNNFRH